MDSTMCFATMVNESFMPKKQGTKLDLLQGTLDMMVMRTLLTGPANGYEIAKAIERASDDVLAVDHGSLYPALYRLEKNGLIAGKWEISSTHRRARYYRLTPAGKKRLVADQSKWEQMAAAITRVMRPA
jgi:PadR family transcriptional regulator, regulatory protein PadR